MEFQLSEDFVKENELNENQIAAVTGYVKSEYVPTLKKDWDGLANTNAEKILDGAAKKARDMFGVELDREQGEKYGDYLGRISEKANEKARTDLAEKQTQIDEKLKNFKGDAAYKEQLEALQAEKDTLLQQVAELEPLKGLDEKYKQQTETLSGLKLSVAFNGVKPSFPSEVNEYEAKAKWDEFQKNTLEKYNIEIVDGVPMAVDKENQYKTEKLSDLLKKDESITSLLQGRQQSGTGARAVELRDVEGVPFKVPTNATTEERSKAIREYLTTTLKLNVTSREYSTKFAELNKKIATAKAA